MALIFDATSRLELYVIEKDGGEGYVIMSIPGLIICF